MCGIFCMLLERCENIAEEFNAFKSNIRNRGPDFFGSEIFESDQFSLIFTASVLWLQGEELVKQPLINEKSIFVYNGDIFEDVAMPSSVRQKSGDTTQFLDKLENFSDIFSGLNQIQGPYAFIYFDKTSLKLYFGRDVFGRRSLLIGKNRERLILTSVAKRHTDYSFIELPVLGVFCYDLIAQSISLLPWQIRHKNFNTKLGELNLFLQTSVVVEEFVGEPGKLFREPREEDLIYFTSDFGIEKLVGYSKWSVIVDKLKALLMESVEKRTAIQPKNCVNCINKSVNCEHSLIGVLFSGGVDCAILALLSDAYIDKNRPIDLINVAFDKIKDYKTPDRITGLHTLEELKRLRPNRDWNFIEVNVTSEELDEERNERIADLIFPLNTILDDSLGCALWFASRALTEKGKASCRVLLSGMGADELFGGYTKHRTALRRRGWLGLHESLEEDWQNLPHRNLARDDRVVADHGRQLRTPYLDENVVDFVRDLDCWQKTCPMEHLQQGLGEKLLLRCLAYTLGLKNASVLKKRALQFGSKIANNKEDAKNVSHRLL